MGAQDAHGDGGIETNIFVRGIEQIQELGAGRRVPDFPESAERLAREVHVGQVRGFHQVWNRRASVEHAKASRGFSRHASRAHVGETFT